MINTFSPVCPKCGITKKSGKISCCGRGGSWFGNCGSAGGKKLLHTWNEGLESCNARVQSKAVVLGQQYKGAEQGRNGASSSDGNDNARAVTTAFKPLASTSSAMPVAPPIIPLVHFPAEISRVTDAPTSRSSFLAPDVARITSARSQVDDSYNNISKATPARAQLSSQGDTVHASIFLTAILNILFHVQFNF